jgi:hypothetical protein
VNGNKQEINPDREANAGGVCAGSAVGFIVYATDPDTHTRGDSDPNDERMIPGLNSSPYGAMFFVEPIREFNVFSSEQRLLVHELAHQFGVPDSYISGSSPTNDVMGVGMYYPGAKFYGDALNTIRSKIESPNR